MGVNEATNKTSKHNRPREQRKPIAEAGDVDLLARLEALHHQHKELADEAAEVAVRAARRRWTIHAEVLAGVESPPGDQSVRLELQVNRLAEGLGRRGGERMELPAVLNAWVAAGADLGDDETAQWRVRLEQAIDVYLG